MKFHITVPDEALRPTLQQHIDRLNKPKGSLGRLEELALQIGLILQATAPELRHPCHLLFGADHGIEREGVSVSPREVTWQQMVNFTQGGGGVNMFCRQHGIELHLYDVGVDHDLTPYPAIRPFKIRRGTRNFLHEAALTPSEADYALHIGAEAVDERADSGCNVLSIGEMGIANTSPSAVWMHLLTGLPLADCIGAGAGLNRAGVVHKAEVLHRAVERFHAAHPDFIPGQPSYEDCLTVLCEFGGYEMVSAVGAMLRAAERRMVVLVDGFIMSACMLMASRLYPEVLPYAVFTHEGDEAGHRLLLQSMGARGLLSLGLRLGEGTGALCAYPLLQSAVAMLREMNTFERSGITKYF